MEAWLDLRAIRIPRPKLVSTISAATTITSVSSIVSGGDRVIDNVIANRNLEDFCLDSGSVNHRSLNDVNGLAEGKMDGHN